MEQSEREGEGWGGVQTDRTRAIHKEKPNEKRRSEA